MIFLRIFVVLKITKKQNMKTTKKLFLIGIIFIIACSSCKSVKISQKSISLERSEYFRLQEKEKNYPYPKCLNWTKDKIKK